jgi:hypothetical protein
MASQWPGCRPGHCGFSLLFGAGFGTMGARNQASPKRGQVHLSGLLIVE